MGQAIRQMTTLFPFASILKRSSGLARFPELRMGEELSLETLMSDPIVRQLMAADNLVEGDVRSAIARAQKRLLHH